MLGVMYTTALYCHDHPDLTRGHALGSCLRVMPELSLAPMGNLFLEQDYLC